MMKEVNAVQELQRYGYDIVGPHVFKRREVRPSEHSLSSDKYHANLRATMTDLSPFLVQALLD